MSLRTSRRSRAARAAALLLLLPALSLGVAACGGDDEPDEPAAPEAEPPAAEGDPQAGREVFASAGCGGCHYLEDAGATGTIGVNLDDLGPGPEDVVQAVTTGPGAMPDFSDQLTDEEIQDVAAYVSSVAGR